MYIYSISLAYNKVSILIKSACYNTFPTDRSNMFWGRGPFSKYVQMSCMTIPIEATYIGEDCAFLGKQKGRGMVSSCLKIKLPSR